MSALELAPHGVGVGCAYFGFLDTDLVKASFALPSVEAMNQQQEKTGGKIFMPPTDIPKTGRFAMLQDPQGAVFAIIKLTM